MHITTAPCIQGGNTLSTVICNSLNVYIRLYIYYYIHDTNNIYRLVKLHLHLFIHQVLSIPSSLFLEQYSLIDGRSPCLISFTVPVV